ncbi:hypothetical protein AZE42_04738 [Rhizopogon vesiculosus]|uniref:Uncharacterized protein n=1 Tax=Rhizopogon vesiculosus TaxID=180088 RepID=A0A1J8PU21_9AGAM|nr:hypothetical protein AZE42_04738 [Rhizopogon vesiculosus]
MNFPDSSSCSRGFEEHLAEPYHVAGSAHGFAFGFEEMFWPGYQDHDFSMQAAVSMDNPLAVGILIDECTALSPSSMPPSSSSASQVEEPYLVRSTGAAAAHDEHTAHEFAPVNNDFRQGSMGDGLESHVHCPLPPFGGQWQNGEQDAITYLEPSSVIDHHHLPEPSGVVGHHHVPAVGGDMMVINSAAHATPNSDPLVFRCKHHTRGQPCGLLIEGDIQDALEHFAHVHVRPMVTRSGSPSEFWTCRWGGKCNIRVRKGNFRRHVVGHFFRWKCLNCLRTYSRDDSARKHANVCGDGSIIMVPRLNARPPKRRKRSDGNGRENKPQACL